MITSHTEPLRRIVLELSGVGKKYAFQGKVEHDSHLRGQTDFWALKDVSFQAAEGEVLGIIGRNGAGKTTCLNIIAGALSPTVGAVRVEGKVLGLFNLGAGFQDELSGRENIFLNGAILGAERKEIEEKVNLIIEFSELGKFIDMPLGSYSSGMRLRLAFSIMANLNFDLLVVDEVLAVGDILFQSKCFERLMEFKRQGKSLIFTSQSIEVIERFCGRVILFDHGKIAFCGAVSEGINLYRKLLNTQKFYVGTQEETGHLFTETKKWADDVSSWGQVTGAKEIKIDAVRLFNRLGIKCAAIHPGKFLSIRIDFTAQDDVKKVHFGVALFRQDGVYCYGPNTDFDGYIVEKLKKGKGFCIFTCPHVCLAAGEYKLSVAIWDKHEKIAYDYRDGYYRLKIKGRFLKDELLTLPYRQKDLSWARRLKSFLSKRNISSRIIAAAQKENNDIASENIKIAFFNVFDGAGKKQDVLFTHAPVIIRAGFTLQDNMPYPGPYYLYAGIYRNDGILCQRIFTAFNNRHECEIQFPHFSLLPGQYRISSGIWDDRAGSFLMLRNNLYDLQMVFNKPDHGTVFIEHSWKIGGNNDESFK